MSTIANVITDIRVEVQDSDSTRFSSDTTHILPLVKQAIRRANRVIQRNHLQFGKKKAALTTVYGQAHVDLPTDFDVELSLWNTDSRKKLTLKTEDEYEEMSSSATFDSWYLDVENSRILLKGTPGSAVNLVLYYFPVIDPSAYDTSTTMPWGGRLDDIVARYVSLRLQNIDEMNLTVDTQLLADLETQIIESYRPLNPTMIERAGWVD